jgi:GT2 family glycosyltransferase
MTPRVSVVIISRNERDLDETLRHVVPQCAEIRAEVLVVDASAGRLDDIASRYPTVGWIEFTRRPGKRYTIPEQRNLGVRSSAGDVVVFTDCGAVPEPGWLAALTTPILAGAEKIVAGVVRPRRPSVYEASAARDAAQRRYVDECATGNLAFTKSAYTAVGGFDETFDYGSDVDISWRWCDAGYRILREPSAVVSMDWGTQRRQLRRSLLWGAGRAKLYVKHRHRLREVGRRDPTAVVYPAFLLGLPLVLLTPQFPLVMLYPAALGIPLWRNRRRHPLWTVSGHLAYGAGVLWQLAREAMR